MNLPGIPRWRPLRVPRRSVISGDVDGASLFLRWRHQNRLPISFVGENVPKTDDELLPLAHAVSPLGFAQLDGRDLQLTPLGGRYVEGEHEVAAATVWRATVGPCAAR